MLNLGMAGRAAGIGVPSKSSLEIQAQSGATTDSQKCKEPVQDSNDNNFLEEGNIQLVSLELTNLFCELNQ